MLQGAVNALHDASDPRNPNKLPRLVYASNQQQLQQQQQQQQQQHNSPLPPPADSSDFSFPTAFMGAALQGPLFV